MPKKIPMRMCVVCRQMFPKNQLIRLVKADDKIIIDSTGKVSGRGAYICPNPDCINKCIKKRVLDKVFEEKLDDEIYDNLLLDYEKLAKNN